MLSKGTVLLAWVFFVHLAGIYLFTNGFLLTRLALSEFNNCTTCTIPPTHKRVVFLVIDALRFDFITANPPDPPSPFHHNVLTLPRELTAAKPRNSFIFNAHADPPTTTLQRIKGLTTGSLPTFIDMGSNFGGSSIAEDSIIKQIEHAGKKIAFMGDNTWLSVFSDSFQTNMSYPYDSFNVEDLHTVDEGVTEHLIPLLQDPSNPWDFLIGHFLGVDHVGHRMGPDHPTMKAKLEQMNDVLTRTVELLHEDTLLVLIGDHGMDRTGDHGGDGELEVSSGVWIYSKGLPLSIPSIASTIPSELLPTTTFSGTPSPHRAIQQIDLVPALSLLLGLPIPFNNLGSIIPELFARKNILPRALQLNADQIHQYLDTYRASPSGSELDNVWPALHNAWAATKAAVSTQAQLVTLNNYNGLALASCRSLWAQFNVVLMSMGLVLLGVGVLACWALYSRLGKAKENWGARLDDILPMMLRGMAGGAILGIVSYVALRSYLEGIDPLHFVIFNATLVSCLVIITSASPSLPPSFTTLKSIPLPLILHTLSFLSNSFTVWEDRIVLFLLMSTVVPSVLTGLAAPTPRLRYRILGFSALFALCVRLMAMSTICREEQQPFCHVTFYASSSLPIPPLLTLILVLPTSFVLPYLIRSFLAISKSDKGVVTVLLPYFFTPALLSSSAHWLLEWADLTATFGSEWSGSAVLRSIRTGLAWFSIGGMLMGGMAVWWFVPLCLEISMDQQGADNKSKKQVTILGFANALGAPYLIFWCIFLSVVYATSMLTSQIVLGLTTVALVAYLEVMDSVRDVRKLDAAFTSSTPSTALDLDALRMSPSSLTFSEIVPLALLGIHAFYGTGHQSTIPSIQWKSGFLLTSTLAYPSSPMTVLINSFGPQFLLALASPLLASWNVPPLPLPSSPNAVQGQSIRAALGMSLYYATLLFGSALSAGVLRRHLMVWKIFAPRFMMAGASLVAVDFAVLVGIAFGVERVRERVERIFKGVGNHTGK